MILIQILSYGPITHILPQFNKLQVIPDAAREICPNLHTLDFAYDFFRYEETEISTAYLAHMIADSYAHCPSSIIQGAKSTEEYREGQLCIDTLSANQMNIDMHYKISDISDAIFEFLFNSNYYSTCFKTQKEFKQEFEKFLLAVTAEYYAEHIGGKVITDKMLGKIHGGQCGQISQDQATFMLNYEMNWTRNGIEMGVEWARLLSADEFKANLEADVDKFETDVNGSICNVIN
ncbi:Hypothetical_protein [Hexamita inflata]|uniref:Hypothetical_protein n=1 Tax=Hexamita inflata TaxID=28002 RepID=A0AA86PCA8_9EUKA|nr:Hypothetical protein HINF_LOCUS23796 [Hexamita inflata]